MLDNYQVTKLWNEWLLKVSAMMFHRLLHVYMSGKNFMTSLHQQTLGCQARELKNVEVLFFKTYTWRKVLNA